MQEITECRNELQSLKSIVRKIYSSLVLKNKNEYYSLGFIRRSSYTTIIFKYSINYCSTKCFNNN